MLFALLSHPFAPRQRAELLSYQGCNVSCTVACSKALTAVPAYGRELLSHRSHSAACEMCRVRQMLQREKNDTWKKGSWSTLTI